MSTLSVIRACQLKVAGLTASNFPNSVLPVVYFAEAPATDGSAAQVQVTTQGYVVLTHQGTSTTTYSFGRVTRDVVRLEFEVFYPSLGDSLTAWGAIKTAFDFGTLPDLDASLKLLSMRPKSDQPQRSGLGKTGVPVHEWKYGFEVEILRGT